MSTIKVNNLQHPSAASPAIVLDAAGNATVAGMGLVLVKPTSIANSGGSAALSGGAVTFTGVTSVSLNGCFSANYDNYLVLVRNSWADASGNPYLDLRLRLSGTDSAVSYSYVLTQAFTAIAVDTNANNTTLARISRAGDINNGLGSNNINIFAPFLAQRTTFVSDCSTPYAATSNKRILSSGDHSPTTSYDGFTLLPSASNITGNIRVYGYQN